MTYNASTDPAVTWDNEAYRTAYAVCEAAGAAAVRAYDDACELIATEVGDDEPRMCAAMEAVAELRDRAIAAARAQRQSRVGAIAPTLDSLIKHALSLTPAEVAELPEFKPQPFPADAMARLEADIAEAQRRGLPPIAGGSGEESVRPCRCCECGHMATVADTCQCWACPACGRVQRIAPQQEAICDLCHQAAKTMLASEDRFSESPTTIDATARAGYTMRHVCANPPACGCTGPHTEPAPVEPVSAFEARNIFQKLPQSEPKTSLQLQRCSCTM